MNAAIHAPRIFEGDQFLTDHAVIFDDALITAVVPLEKLPADCRIERLAEGTLAPGFIDWQVNGGGGVLFNNDISAAGIASILQGHYQGGTTALMPTLISDTGAARDQAVELIKSIVESDESSVLGLHLEGPYFADEKRGAHDAQFIRAALDSDIERLTAIDSLRVIMTLAPECLEPGQIRRLVDSGILVSAGHTNADAALIHQAIDEGLRGFTHLYNAMRPATSREPGTVGAALASDETWCGIIVDGYHVHPDMVRLAHKAKPAGKLCLVTDAMATVGSAEKSFDLYGQTISEQDGRLVNHEGRLAGSAISMIDAVRHTHQQVGIELAECLRMASRNPAHFLGVEQSLGSLAQGYRADMVWFDDQFQVVQCWVAGQPKLPS